MEVWAQVIASLRGRLNRQSIDTWFGPLSLISINDSRISISVPNETFRRTLLENYRNELAAAVLDAVGRPLEIDIRSEETAASLLSTESSSSTAEGGEFTLNLNSRYTFDSFVVGSSNQFARAAAYAVAERPSNAYNPLYIYGGVGLGKTHLMHAVGHYIRKKTGNLRIAYMSSERFMNELVNSIRYDRILQFRRKYRSIDILLMDDVQFLAGKERTQEEFFHTFNALYDAQKQIVITSDCAPREIPTLEERLHSRFEWGLIADIQPPDLETKLAILKKKAASEWFQLPDAVALYIARNIRSNIRELEGALIRLTARASLEGIEPTDIDEAYAREVLRDLVVEDKSAVSSEAIIRAVSAYFGLKPAQLKSRSNARRISEPRQIAMYLCKHLSGLSLPQIGKDLGGKHHTTVLHSIRKIDQIKKKNTSISEALEKILQSIR